MNKIDCNKVIISTRQYDLFAISICIFISLIVYAVVIFNDVIIPNIDTNTHYRWLVQFQAALSEGTFYPRWMPLANLGLGELHVGAYPAYQYLASILILFGFEPWFVMKLFAVLSNFFGGLIVYFSFRNLIGQKWSIISAFFWQITPFSLFLFTHHSSLPWQFSLPVATTLVLQTIGYRSKPSKVWLTLTVAMLILTHTLVAFMTLLCLSLLKLADALKNWKSFKEITIEWAIPIALGIGLVAFHLLPAIFSRELLNTVTGSDPIYLNWRNSFIFPTITAAKFGMRWFSVQWIIPGITLFCLVSSSYALWHTYYQRDKIWFLLARLSVISFLGLIFASEIAFPLYNFIGLFRSVQWPYRFITVTAIGCALALPLAVVLCRSINDNRICCSVCWSAFAATLLLLVGLNLQLIREGTSPNLDSKLLEGNFHQQGAELATTGTEWEEYVRRGGFEGNCQNMQANCKSVLYTSQHRIWMITTEKHVELILPLFAFPGWAIHLDTVEIPFSIDLPTGLVAVEIPPGQHLLEIELKSLPQEQIGFLISFASIIWLLIISLYPWFKLLLNLLLNQMRS
jgi:hypothetical protein